MDSMKALADTNVKVSEARAIFEDIKKTESVFLVERERKALIIIDKVIVDSKTILDEAKGNYDQVMDLYRTISEFSEFLSKEYTSFKSLLDDFDRRNIEWTAQTNLRQTEIDAIMVQINSDKVRIKNDREGIDRDRDKLAIDRKKLNDDRGVVDRAIIRLKQNRI